MPVLRWCYLSGVVFVGLWVLFYWCQTIYFRSELFKPHSLPVFHLGHSASQTGPFKSFSTASTSNRSKSYYSSTIFSSPISYGYLKNSSEGSNLNVGLEWHDIQEVILRTNDCNEYFQTFPILGVNEDLMKLEKRIIQQPHPIAFSHLVHKDIAILEIFLSLYFRPNNYHCIHIDKKAEEKHKQAIANLVACYASKVQSGAIFTIPENESVSVGWGGNTILVADMKCLKMLLEYKNNKNISWTHSSSIAGSELPIVSYSTFHNKLSLNLAQNRSSVESFLLPKRNFFRISKQQLKYQNQASGRNDTNEFRIPNPLFTRRNQASIQEENQTTRTKSLSLKQNMNITFSVFKGIRNVILSAKDAHFIINSPVARALYYWFQLGMLNAEEHFYSTVIRFNVNTTTGVVLQNTSATFLGYNSGGITTTSGNTLHGVCPRYTSWGCQQCHGECRNSICNFHSLDLDKIKEDKTDCLIANKFSLDVDPNAIILHWTNVFNKVISETHAPVKSIGHLIHNIGKFWKK